MNTLVFGKFGDHEVNLKLNLNQHELEEAVEELDAAIESQEQWYADFNRALICHVPPSLRDLSTEAHHLCSFGAWLDVYGNEEIRRHPLFEKIGHDHKFMHRMASRLLSKVIGGKKIAVDEYETFYAIQKRLRLRLHTLNNELKNKVGNIDALTGLYNRREMFDELAKQLELVNRGVYEVSIALMDVDHFKSINDTYGHLSGDRLLAELGDYLKQAVRAYDSVYRYGGDEFLVLLPDTPPQAAREILGRLHKTLGTLTVDANDQRSITVTTSFGVASLRPGIDLEGSIQAADQALYKAKLAGRNRLQLEEVH
jgi:diguanylate cyclase (GGDEF)-like protein